MKWESSHGHFFKPSSSPRFPPGNKLQWDQGTLLLHIRNTKLLPVPVESGSPPSQSRVSVPPAPSAPPGEAHTEKSALPTRFSKNQRCKTVLNDSKSADGFLSLDDGLTAPGLRGRFLLRSAAAVCVHPTLKGIHSPESSGLQLAGRSPEEHQQRVITELWKC